MTDLRNDFIRAFYPMGLALGLILLPAGARAFDFAPDASRVLSDPAYLPLGGQVFGGNEYTFGLINSKIDDHLGAQKSSNDNKTHTINQTLEYGVTDDFTLRLGGFYQWLETDNTPVSGGSAVSDSDGFSDPT